MTKVRSKAKEDPMDDSQVAPSRNALAQYGDSDVIKELGIRVKAFLPNGDKMTERQARSFAQTALALNLNPFAGEVWFIPGMGIVTGIAGYRKLAKPQSRFSVDIRLMTAGERDKHNLGADDKGAVCELYRHDILREAVEINVRAGSRIVPVDPIIGTGIWRATELKTRSGKTKSPPTGRSWQWIAEKRAEADALRKAFDLTLPFSEKGNGEVHVIDGTVIDEPVVKLSGWAVEVLKDESAPLTEEAMAEKRAILHGPDEDADWDAPNVKKPPTEQPTPEIEEPAPSTDLPTEWQPFAKHAIETLGYRNINHVRDTLHKQGVTTICTPLGKLEFDPLDGWALLKDQAPQARPQQAKMAV